ncbi:hypothetical protein AC579_8156 [Pseudocercospora musae]|uniref:Uncharacterized protein n=1 Tax=Pseudocercospora musae TaxID=113226 RepID=A0A139IV59_9PEZI|nr:hypothetical protein AC579_8156 [Pseudocercospora musae]KXT18429.1 hypothetical protein AC579_8156 [Pseudocercospora musae]
MAPSVRVVRGSNRSCTRPLSVSGERCLSEDERWRPADLEAALLISHISGTSSPTPPETKAPRDSLTLSFACSPCIFIDPIVYSTSLHLLA